ncbi:hypothetical protein [Streptomyces mordarskii]|uniref:Uncharacterized protein n=1 Tax=Streptomyces mordarskii TaxID=1226758 RepID=A0ABP3PYF4_9ACTN
MAKKNRNNDDNTVVNIAAPGSVVGIQCGGSIVDTTVTVNGSRSTIDDQYPGGRRIDIEDMDRSLISNPDNPDD